LSLPTTGTMNTTPDHQPGADARADELRAEISARLRRVCAHLTEEQFSTLVDDITSVTIKYDDFGAISLRPRPRAD